MMVYLYIRHRRIVLHATILRKRTLQYAVLHALRKMVIYRRQQITKTVKVDWSFLPYFLLVLYSMALGFFSFSCRVSFLCPS